MEDVNIVALFVGDHKRIANLLHEFKKGKNKRTDKSKERFNQLNYSLRKHFKQEEVLYLNYKQKTGDFIPGLQSIRREHRIIVEYLDKIRKTLNGTGVTHTSDFFAVLERHKNIEERLLYPELDNILTEKEEVYWKIKMK